MPSDSHFSVPIKKIDEAMRVVQRRGSPSFPRSFFTC
jgi:hypothetical protein